MTQGACFQEARGHLCAAVLCGLRLRTLAERDSQRDARWGP